LNPLFSIIIPCYNQAHFLPDCIESLLVQEFQNWEAIVVNDGSTDATSEVTKKYVEKDSRIKLVEKVNGGLSSARNFGIKNAKGSRFIFLDADDFLYPNCLQNIALAIQDSDENTLIQYGYTYITQDKVSVLHTVLPSEQKNIIPQIFSAVLGPCHSICISKKLCDSIGFFDERLRSVEDWDFWLRAAKAGATQIAIKMPLVYYRYVRNSMSRNAFVMYDAIKTVVLRGPQKDSRISHKSPWNKEYDFDTTPVLQKALIRCLGVSIMQGEIENSVSLFEKESTKPINKYNPDEFSLMCSYLSFRYWYSPTDIKMVFKTIYPSFKLFFEAIKYEQKLADKALFHIFKQHYYYQNNYRFGKKIGSFFNLLLRLKYDK
jgi:glycosyltransferase involved in cell wall biosynthesis